MKKFTDMEKYATIIAVLNDLDVNDLYKVDDENYISVAELIEFINYKMALIEKRNAKRDAKSSADYERLSKAIAEVLTGHTMTVTEIINETRKNMKTNKAYKSYIKDVIKPTIRLSGYHIAKNDLITTKLFLEEHSPMLLKVIDECDFGINNRTVNKVIKCQAGEMKTEEMFGEIIPMILVSAVLTHLDYPFVEYDAIVIWIMDALEEIVKERKNPNIITQTVITKIKQNIADKVIELHEEAETVCYDDILKIHTIVLNDNFFESCNPLKKAINDRLTDREKTVIILRFGLHDEKYRTLEEVGKQFGVSRDRIRQIEAKSLRKLRGPKHRRSLIDYLSNQSNHGCVNESYITHGYTFGKIQYDRNKIDMSVEEILNELKEKEVEPDESSEDQDNCDTLENYLKSLVDFFFM